MKPIQTPRSARVLMNVYIPKEDKDVLQRVFPTKGVLTWAVCEFTKALTNELKQRGITSWTTESADTLIAIVERRCADYKPPTSDDRGDGRGPVKTVRRPRKKVARRTNSSELRTVEGGGNGQESNEGNEG